MTIFQIILLILSALIIIFGLLFAGFYNYLFSQKKHLERLWSDLLIAIQYYCDNVPYTIEAYRLLKKEDKDTADNLIDLKVKCLSAKISSENLEDCFIDLRTFLNKIFELRHQDQKAAHDLRFIEAYTEFKRLDKEIEQKSEEYTHFKDIYDQKISTGILG